MAKNVACKIVCLLLSTLAMAFFAYTTAKLVQHTPVYRPLECTTTSTEYGEQVMDSTWVNTSGTTVKSCRNRNHFNMRLYQGEHAQVYVKDELLGLIPVGESIMKDSTFVAGGEGTGGVTLKIALTFFQAMQLMSKDRVQVVAEINAVAEAETFFLGVGFKIAQESSKFCGFEMAMVPVQKTGLSACANTLDELVIPDIDATMETADLITMSPEMYAYETRRKNLGFGTLLVVSGVLAISLLACGVLAGRRGRSRLGDDAAKDARDVKVEAPAAEGKKEPVLLGSPKKKPMDKDVAGDKQEDSQANAGATEGATRASL